MVLRTNCADFPGGSQKLPVPQGHLQVSLSHSRARNDSLTPTEPHLKDLALLVHMGNVLESLNSA